MAGLFGGGGGTPAPAPMPVLPPAPGTLVQTVLSRPGPVAIPPVGETEEERRRRLDMQGNILGGGIGGMGSDSGGGSTGGGDSGGGTAP